MIVDSLTHPTLDELWINGLKGENFKKLSSEMEAFSINHAFVCGLPGVGSYEHSLFYNKSLLYDCFTPIAAITKKNLIDIQNELVQIKTIGFGAVKIHERLLKIQFNSIELSTIFKTCEDLGLIVYYCTYYCCVPSNMPHEDPFWKLRFVLEQNPEVKLVLVHGGGVRLLEYAELVRFSKNTILDLSLTLLKYRKSSIDNDIDFLCHNFDRRICLGSDHPEYTIEEFSERVHAITKKLPKKKKDNILGENIMKFWNI